MYKTFYSLFALTVVSTVNSANILAIFPVPLRDHQIIFRPLIQNLINREHNLTIVTTDPQSFPKNGNDGGHVEIIDLSFAHDLEVMNLLKDQESADSGSEMLQVVFHVMRNVAEAELKSKEMQKLIKNENNQKFDVVIVDWSGPAVMNAFAYQFNAPLVGITPGGAYSTAHSAIGNPNHPVAFPSVLMPFSEDLTLYQRIASTIFSIKYRYIYFEYELPLQDVIAKKFFGPEVPELSEIESNTDLLLVNSYLALGNSRPVGPTTVFMGGIHSSLDKAITPELKDFLLKSTNDIVYLNLGGYEPTNIFIESGRLDKLLQILEKSSFEIILNLHGNSKLNFNMSTRVFQDYYIPQENVLANKNVKLFVTLGGQRDIEDAIHHKVPIFGLTFSSILEHYLLQIIKNDAGLTSAIDMETSAEILAKIETFAITERYQKNIENLHRIVMDAPMSSMERGIWWIEYVIRNKGTQHLKTPWNKLSWIQYLLFDVFLTITIIICILIASLALIISKIRRYSKSLPYEKITKKAKML